MSKLLAIETSSDACSVALHVDEVVTELFEHTQRQHAHVILPMIEKLLTQAGIELEQLHAIAFGCGPGSFTGLRIGTSVVQALSFAANLPVIPVSSLQTLAQTAYHDFGAEKVLVAVDARMHDIYWGVYRLNTQGIMQAECDDTLCKPQEVELPTEPGWIGVGDAWTVYQSELNHPQLQNIQPQVYPQARALLQIANNLFAQGQWVSSQEALPVYLRGATAWKTLSQQGSTQK